jgi:kynurenine formamidase
VGAAGLLALACAPAAPPFSDATIVDLSHAFDSETIYWPTEEGFVLEHGSAGLTEGGYYYAANRFRGAEHGGTHIDAPIHFAEGRQTVDQIPVERLVGPAVVLDVSAACAADPDYAVGVADLERFEAEHGRIQAGEMVLLHTGYARHWPDRRAYLGTDRRGPDAVPELHFPGLDPAAARWLASERAIAAIGIDTASIDPGQSKRFESHQILFAANIPAFESLTALDRLPPRGSVVVALPMKIRGGSGGPLRAIAVLPDGP